MGELMRMGVRGGVDVDLAREIIKDEMERRLIFESVGEGSNMLRVRHRSPEEERSDVDQV